MYNKNFNTRITKMLEKSKVQESNPKYLLRKLLQDSDNLEKFHSNPEFRKRLVSANYPSSEYFQLEGILEQDEKVKEKLNLSQNSTIRYEKVKCSKNCRHNTHQYYYAYIWDSNSKKLKKKYIGKQLPLPVLVDYSSFIRS
jgi:hypothetical protein